MNILMLVYEVFEGWPLQSTKTFFSSLYCVWIGGTIFRVTFESKLLFSNVQTSMSNVDCSKLAQHSYQSLDVWNPVTRALLRINKNLFHAWKFVQKLEVWKIWIGPFSDACAHSTRQFWPAKRWMCYWLSSFLRRVVSRTHSLRSKQDKLNDRFSSKIWRIPQTLKLPSS